MITKDSMRYIIYCRKSTDTEDKQVASLDSQESYLLQLARTHNLNIVSILKESKSAKAEGRPVFNEVIRMLRTGEVDAILCWKLDRLARNFIDAGLIIDLLQKNIIQEIRTHESVHSPSDNVLMLAFPLGMANQYIRDLSVNVKRGNQSKRERGEYPNHAPFGYYNDKATKTLKVDKEVSPYILKMFELFATGSYSLKEVSDLLYEEGLRTKSGRKILKSHIHRILNHRIYTGFFEYQGKVYVGKHEAIVSPALFKKVHDVFSGRLHPKKKKHFYSARGFLLCAQCGCAITADTKKGHHYYYCTNGRAVCDQRRKYLRSETVDKLLSELFLNIHFDEELIAISYEAYKRRKGGELSYSTNALQSLQNELDGLSVKESLLTDSYSSQVLGKELYQQKMLEVKNSRVVLSKQIAEMKQNSVTSSGTFERILEIFLDGNRAAERYLVVDDEEKRNMLGKLLSNAKIENQKVAQYQFKSPYQVLANTPKNISLNEMLRCLVWYQVP